MAIKHQIAIIIKSNILFRILIVSLWLLQSRTRANQQLM